MLQGQGHPHKMDKTTILQRTIDFLQQQKGKRFDLGKTHYATPIIKSLLIYLMHPSPNILDITPNKNIRDMREDWKPAFLSNGDFTQLMLEVNFRLLQN